MAPLEEGGACPRRVRLPRAIIRSYHLTRINVFVGSIFFAVFSFFPFFLAATEFILLRIRHPAAEVRLYRWQFRGQSLRYKRLA